MELLAGITGAIGAIMLALNLAHSLQFTAYSLFAVSSMGWILIAIQTEQQELMLMNIVFTLINLIGMKTRRKAWLQKKESNNF